MAEIFVLGNYLITLGGKIIQLPSNSFPALRS